MACAVSLKEPSSLRQWSMSTPTIPPTSVNTKPTPVNRYLSFAARACASVAQLCGLVEDALRPSWDHRAPCEACRSSGQVPAASRSIAAGMLIHQGTSYHSTPSIGLLPRSLLRSRRITFLCLLGNFRICGRDQFTVGISEAHPLVSFCRAFFAPDIGKCLPSCVVGITFVIFVHRKPPPSIGILAPREFFVVIGVNNVSLLHQRQLGQPGIGSGLIFLKCFVLL